MLHAECDFELKYIWLTIFDRDLNSYVNKFDFFVDCVDF